MSKNEYVLYMPLRPARCMDPDAALVEINNLVCSDFHLKPNLRDIKEDVSIQIELLEKDQIAEKYKSHLPEYDSHFLKFKSTFETNEKLIEKTRKELENIEATNVKRSVLIDLSHDHFSSIFYDYICAFNMVCNLAIPGISTISDKPMIFLNKKPLRTGYQFINEFYEFFYESKNLLSKLKTLNIEETWNWSIKNSGFLDLGFTDNNVSRSFAAFYQLFILRDISPYPHYFIWSILGIEALYVEGAQGSKKQILEKSKLLLGLNSKTEKQIKDMYEFRSNFFHGHKNLYNPHFLPEEHKPEVSDFNNKEWSYLKCSLLLFLASLQYCVENNIHDLQFELKVKS